MKALFAKLLMPLVLVALSSVAHATELVTNGDFSNGSTDWTIKRSNPALNSLKIYNGEAQFTSLSGNDQLSQIIDTVVGNAYTLSFDLKVTAGTGSHNYFAAYFGDGNLVYSASNTGFGWTHITITNLIATSSKTVLSFYGSNFGSVTRLDNVSVVPLPASAYLMMSALGLIGFLATRRRSENTANMANFA